MYVKPAADIREKKNEMRVRFKTIRSAMTSTEKAERDAGIFARLVAAKSYRNAKILLCFVSTAIEVDTYGIIERALSDGKTVAVPRCIDGTREMDFYIISSFDQLEKGAFSVMEPCPERCEKLCEFDGALCIVPGLAFDVDGYRLGYGKGYYDRFLTAHPNMVNFGVCYCSCTVPKLIRGRFDKAVDALVTEKFVRRTGGGHIGK